MTNLATKYRPFKFSKGDRVEIIETTINSLDKFYYGSRNCISKVGEIQSFEHGPFQNIYDVMIDGHVIKFKFGEPVLKLVSDTESMPDATGVSSDMQDSMNQAFKISEAEWNGQPIIPNSGKLDGQGQRFNEGKLRMDLIPPSTMIALSKALTYGAGKYAPNNWRRGMPWSVPTGCLLRHFTAWQAGEDIDQESGVHHLHLMLANLSMLVEFVDSFKSGDDRFLPNNLKDE